MLISFDPGNLKLADFLEEQPPNKAPPDKPQHTLREVGMDELVIFEKFNSRQSFDETELQKLADSFAEVGVRVPIEVVAGRAGTAAEGKYMVIAGERRARAAERLMLRSLPAVVTRHNRRSALLVNLTENALRQDLHAWEKAAAIQRLHEDENLGFDEIGRSLGCTVSYVRSLYRCATRLHQEVAAGWRRNPGASTEYVIYLAGQPQGEQQALWQQWLERPAGGRGRKRGSGKQRRPTARLLERKISRLRVERSSEEAGPRAERLELAETVLSWAASGEPAHLQRLQALLGVGL